MKKVVITGACGFVGAALAKKMAYIGYKVYAVLFNEQVKNELLKYDNIVTILGDLSDYNDIASKIDTDIDVVIHLAWGGVPIKDRASVELQRHNIDISVNAVKLAHNLNCKRFVFGGSMYEHLVGKSKFNEMYTNATIYGTCKYCANKLCEVLTFNAMEYVAIAFTNVFGVGDRSNRTPNTFIKKLLNGENLDLIEGENLYDWIYVDDAVAGVIAAVEKGVSGKQYIIGNRKLRTFKKIVENVRDIVNPDCELNFGKYQDDTFTDFSYFDIDALYNDTGFECKCDFKESVLKTCEWVKTLNW